MNKTLFIVSLLILIVRGSNSYAESEPRDRIRLNLAKKAMLKDLFDVGLQPWRDFDANSNNCSIGRIPLTISALGSPPFEIDLDRGSFSVINGDEISNASLFGMYEPIPDAVKRIKTIASHFGISTSKLDEIVAHIGINPDSDDRWFESVRTNEGTDIGINFNPLNSMIKTTHAQVWLTIIWRHPVGYNKYPKGPAKAPAGYEFSPYPEHSPQDPHLVAEKAAAEKMAAEEEAKNAPLVKKAALQSPPAETKTTPIQGLIWLGWLMLILASLVVVWRLLRKPNH